MHSSCQDPQLPINSCPLYLHRRVSLNRTSDATQAMWNNRVRTYLKKAAVMQSKQHKKAGLRPHVYTPGAELLYYYPVNVTAKLGPPCIGPYTVIAVDPGKNLVKILLRSAERWINTANVKPVCKLKDGKFL